MSTAETLARIMDLPDAKSLSITRLSDPEVIGVYINAGSRYFVKQFKGADNIPDVLDEALVKLTAPKESTKPTPKAKRRAEEDDLI